MKDVFYNFLSAASFGLILLLSIVVGLGIGIFLDKLFKTNTIFTIIFTVIGMVSGLYSVVKEIRKFRK
ncbi:MAG: hypothetical protein A2474_08810 [Elusimicrobia bacterium RIFOXYC2_FULL_34_12]|nr:MAG: hypothetical protein A2474_08810 [Elusimicrobia bacterium RIFOXYC2_FULL_34_12]OGS38515.1 MAG: hypothetical protein A2551_07855 [Elusimicrobia bacterium RIFOXYD2_FULL_34_30]HAM38104.1 hypothetical protein [Elusimicrobiota bacterium]